MQIFYNKNKENRLTINPNSGRITLKLVNKENEKLNTDIISFTNYIKLIFDGKQTYRGVFIIHKNGINIIMYNDKKTDKKCYKFTG
jgi:hypothetical protein